MKAFSLTSTCLSTIGTNCFVSTRPVRCVIVCAASTFPLWPRNILRMNCPSSSGWLFRFISPAPELRPILLQLDSGSDGPILYPGSEQPEVQTLIHAAALQGGNATSAQRAFAVVPPQNMQIGNHILTHISFVTPVIVVKNLPKQREDGLLPTLLFQRVFISGTDHFVVFDPK